MSHASGEVIKDGKVIGYYEYNGTVDIAYTAIQPTLDEVSRVWRTKENDRQCTCSPQASEPIVLWSSYGRGFYWDAKACLKCMVVTEGRNPFPDEGPSPTRGHPLGHRCDRCRAAMINGVFCHETGCPNTKKVWDRNEARWVEPPQEEEE